MKYKQNKPQKKLRRVEVHWIDSVADDNSWKFSGNAQKWARDKLPLIVSVGFLVHKSREQIVLSRAVSVTGSMAGLSAIPRVAIVKVLDLIPEGSA